MMISMKKTKKHLKREEARELYHNKRLSMKQLASHYGRSKRTIYRWLQSDPQKIPPDQRARKITQHRSRMYPPEIFSRIVELKKEVPQRSTPLIRKILKKEFPNDTPSESTIRKHVREKGLTFKRDPP